LGPGVGVSGKGETVEKGVFSWGGDEGQDGEPAEKGLFKEEAEIAAS